MKNMKSKKLNKRIIAVVSIISESYVNGTFETLYLNKNLADTFTSEGTYPWTKNDSGIWTSYR